MNRIYGLVTLLFLIVAPIRFAYCLCYDMAHPETWGDWMNDPRLYVPFAAATVVFMAVVFLYRVKVGRQAEKIEKRRLRREILGEDEGEIGRRG